jgi:hypothetical protein
MKSRYPLSEVWHLIEEFRQGRSQAIAFFAPSASIRRVVRVLQCNEAEAVLKILIGLERLTEGALCRSFVQWDMVVDEYGLEQYEGHNWYVKLAVVTEDGDRFLDQISFHPLTKFMKVCDGRTLHVTYVEGNS